MSKLKTLRVRFALWTAGLLLVMLILFGAFVYYNTAQNLVNAVDNTLRLTAVQITSDIDIADGELIAIEEFLADERHVSLREQGFTVQILDRAGQTFQVYGPYTTLLQPQPNLAELNSTGVFTTLTAPTTQHRIRVYTTPLFEDQHIAGTIQIAQNLTTLQRNLTQLLTSLLIGVPIVVILAGAGGYFLATRTLAPIDHITRTVQRISVEDLSARLNLPSTDDEVGRLATTFDSMLARLDDAFRRERQFTTDASHELRTPLAAMQTILSNTLARPRASEEYEHALIDLTEEAGRLRKLTQELLSLARNDSDHALKFEPINLSVLLEDIAASFRPLAQEKGVRLVCQIPQNISLLGDSDSLIRMFANLVNNAIKYTEQGQVTVAASRKNSKYVEITITDTGIGIAAEHLPHIFDRFYRTDKSRTTSGSGLGLAIALNVAQMHGGTINVESGVGEGTQFAVQLTG